MLMDGEILQAMTDFNAELPDIVQRGRVCTPSALRGKGHAHVAVGLHLAQAAGRSVKQATLCFVSNMTVMPTKRLTLNPLAIGS